MINGVFLNGRLTYENELKKTQSGHSVLSNTLAVERGRKDSSGNKVTDFIKLVFWRERADAVNKWTKKGDLIGIKGELQTRSYENNSGQKVEVVEVLVDDVQFLQTNNQNQQNNGGSSQSNNYQGNGQTSNYNGGNQAQGYQNNVSGGTPVEIMESDLPF